jgi:hypothetical protein
VYQVLLSGRFLGFAGIGIEQSPSALQLADVLAHDVLGVRITSGLADIPSESQVYLAAFEVLEHIEDDRLAQSEWTRHLRSVGEVLLTAPAHPVR